MNNNETFEDLIKRRQSCTACHCADNLCHFETKLSAMSGQVNLLGPWDPFERNSLSADVLVIGQDFGIVKYLEDAKDIGGLKIQECKNATNKKLTGYLKSAGLNPDRIFFTNAILCIKKGETNKTKSGNSMSSKVEPDWFVNCSERFLKPLITSHLPNLKTIITLGKYALFSINQISSSEIDTVNPFIDLVAVKQDIDISNRQYNLIPMLHPSFDHLSARGQKDGKKAKDLWKELEMLFDNF